ncbi:DsrE family protein [Acetanaerobacterium sp. MSJ-12]|uniref:DsrE family protein n=1 Tax=Oscillospiraceae TaxID=216572 RepID=UPI001C0ED296|nr:DsrE family protein [Acetanaerobacterium sp. MSJ-12]MBU5420683.1 DsrE family protein [Acetanaerobacterium sp. MSJ-12]
MKVLYHVDQVEAWQLAAGNALNMEDYCRREGIACQMELVANGPAVKGLVEAAAPYLSTLAELAQGGTVVAACQNALRANQIDPQQLPDFVRVVPAGVVEIAQRQEEGFSYIKP